MEAELASRRYSLLEWIQSRDRLSKALQCLNLGSQSRLLVAHTLEKAANPTATPSGDELAQKLIEQDNSDINATRVSIDMREATISVLRSRIAVLEEDIAGCKGASSHIKSMIALQASHEHQLQVLLRQYKSRLNPLIQLPDTCLRDIFLHVIQLSWEKWEKGFEGFDIDFLFTRYSDDPMFAVTAVCHRWRTVATQTPELWSKFLMTGPTHIASRFAHYIRLVKDRELSILIDPLGLPDVQSLEIVKSSGVKLDTLVFITFKLSKYCMKQAMRILPSPRILMLLDFERDFLPTSLPRDLLSRTEELYTLRCHATTDFTAPMLRRLELNLESINPLTTPLHYISSLLQNLPQLNYLSILCQTTPGALPGSQLPSLLVSPGVCESVTCLRIPYMALCGPLEGLQASFTLPNLVRLSLLRFLQDGSDLQSWSNFCGLNGGKINRLDLETSPKAPRDKTLSPKKLEFKLIKHINCLPGVKYLSLHACLMRSLKQVLLKDFCGRRGKRGDRLLVPNVETCEIRCAVNDSAARTRFEDIFSSWRETRNIEGESEATVQYDVVTVLWT